MAAGQGTGLAERVSDLLDSSARRFLLALAAVETVTVIVSVIARYGFNNSFPWSEELARAILTWIVFLGAASALKGNEMVAMLSFREALSDRGVLICRLLCEAVIVVFSAFMVYASCRLIALTHRQVFPVTGWPLWIAYSAIPFSGCVIILHTLVRMAKLADGSEPLRQELVPDEIA